MNCRECNGVVTSTMDECPHCGEFPFARCEWCQAAVHPDGEHKVATRDSYEDVKTFVECDQCFEENEPGRVARTRAAIRECQEDMYADR